MKTYSKFLLIVLLLSFTLSSVVGQDKQPGGSVKNKDYHQSYTPSFENDGTRDQIRNVILMIGDGMGLSHIATAMYANQGSLTITNLRAIGFVRTQSADNFTTDSAASGTAYSTGQKTKNGAIGVDPLGVVIQNLPERLSPLGYFCGVITTDDMDGATPSAFYAHQLERGMSADILGDLPSSKLAFFAGGSQERVQSKRPELFKELSKAGYTVVENVSDSKAASAPKLGILPAAKQTQSFKDGRGDFLPATTAFALPYLASKGGKGFFIMIEGARIDKSSHDNDFKSVVEETLDFDKAVEEAIRFAEKDGHTLVIISADHETGGLSMSSQGNISKGEVGGYFRSGGHSPVMVPLFAYGPGSYMFLGVQENSDVSNKIYQILSSIQK